MFPAAHDISPRLSLLARHRGRPATRQHLLPVAVLLHPDPPHLGIGSGMRRQRRRYLRERLPLCRGGGELRRPRWNSRHRVRPRGVRSLPSSRSANVADHVPHAWLPREVRSQRHHRPRALRAASQMPERHDPIRALDLAHVERRSGSLHQGWHRPRHRRQRRLQPFREQAHRAREHQAGARQARRRRKRRARRRGRDRRQGVPQEHPEGQQLRPLPHQRIQAVRPRRRRGIRRLCGLRGIGQGGASTSHQDWRLHGTWPIQLQPRAAPTPLR